MQTSFAKLSADLTNQIAQLTTIIATTICPEKIICYGYRTAIYQDWSCFKDDNSYRHTGRPSFDLFVITGNDNQQADHEIIQKVEQLAAPLECDVSCVLQNLAGVNDLLQKNSRFLTTLYHKGVLLYESNNHALLMPPASPRLEVIQSKLEAAWNRCFGTAQRFYKTACFCLDNGWH